MKEVGLKQFILFALLFLVFSGLKIDAQNIVEGVIKDTNDNPLGRINVLIYNRHQVKELTTFAVSDEKGYFKIEINSKTDSLFIEVNSINYKKEIRKIANKTQQLIFKLTSDVKQLETVIIKAPPIERHHDTITYLVNSFAKKQDRSIEDVLKRMPGIEVEPDGRILYQGVPIRKFYVEGLDLMDGRYSMVSKNLPGSAVGAVEILENHQPLKILQGRMPSVQPALNLKLKRNITLTGTAKLAIGFSPLLWDMNITPMIFNKKIQLLTSYQTNNTGNDVAAQLEPLNYREIVNRKNFPDENMDFLRIISADPPEIGFTYRKQTLETELFVTDGTTKKPRDDFINKKTKAFRTIYREERACLFQN